MDKLNCKKSRLVLLLTVAIVITTFESLLSQEWEYIDSMNGLQSGYNIACLEDNEYLITGQSNPNNNSQILLSKLSDDGDLIWFKEYGFNAADRGYSISILNDGYLIYGFGHPIDEIGLILIKTNVDGITEWITTIPHHVLNSEKSMDVAPDGNIYISSTRVSENPAEISPEVIKVDKDGNLIWIKSFQDFDFNESFGKHLFYTENNTILFIVKRKNNNSSEVYDEILKLDSSGIVLNNLQIDSYDFGTGLKPVADYAGDERIVLAETVNETGLKKITKVDMNNGEIIWDIQLPTTVYSISSITKTVNEEYILLCHLSTSPNNISIILIDEDGYYISQNSYDFGSTDKGLSIIENNDGDYIISGYIHSDQGELDFLVFKVSKNDLLPTSITNKRQHQISIFPNPNNGRFIIKNRDIQKATVTIFDLAGRSVQSFESNYSDNLELSNYSPGSYIINIRKGGNSWNEKLIIH
jgi:hypothetical protein